MRLLVFGGTVFLSKAVAAEAARRGHAVTCACRGKSGGVPEGAVLVEVDRTRPLPDLGQFDAVVDVARHPSWVRGAVAAHSQAHWVFMSTINVYSDDATRGGSPSTLPLREPVHDDVDLRKEPEAYGPMKVACEQAVVKGATSAMVIRPGLIVGPEDPTGRFSYWPRRLAAGGEVLAPGDPADPMQIVDVRDLAAWAVTACESRTTGIYDGVGAAQPLADLLARCAEGVDADVTWTWVDHAFLTAAGLEPWMGPDSIPLWLPRPKYDGLVAHTTCSHPSMRGSSSVRWPRPLATLSPGSTVSPTRLSPASTSSANASCSLPGTPAAQDSRSTVSAGRVRERNTLRPYWPGDEGTDRASPEVQLRPVRRNNRVSRLRLSTP